MRTATDTATRHRPARRTALRQMLGLLGLGGSALEAWALLPAAPGEAPRLVAAWDDETRRHWVGVLSLGTWQVLAAQELPTRAHGLRWEPGGSVLVCARRPGEWLLRWWPGAEQKPRWHWIEPDRRFTGHTLAAPGDARTLFTIEADQASGQGLLVRRDATSLAVQAEWPTHGIDPHQALWEPPSAAHPSGAVLLANGGVPTLPETGRTRRDMARMDTSLVRLDAASGALRQQWRLADARLSLRHLARHASGVVGIALQAEHDDPAQRAAAPLLALLDERRSGDDPALRIAAAPAAAALAGYGGDVAAVPEGFLVSATRAGGVARWSAQGAWLGWEPLEEACALVAAGGGAPGWWAGGREQILAAAAIPRSTAWPALRLDNHAILAGVSLGT